MDETDSFGYWVRRRRKVLDLTQEELAQRIGCASVTLRKIEADERRPSSQMAERLAQCLGLADEECAAFLAAAVGRRAPSRLPPPSGPRGQGPFSNLPAPVTTLVGRAVEIETITDRLRQGEVRLLTLTGPVGVGKTRLALEVGRRLCEKYRAGVFLVALASVRDPALTALATAAALGVRESRDRDTRQAVIDFLTTREMLLIFDNFEHVQPAAPFLADLLAACPDLHLLVTSRARLHLYGEHEFVVSPLPLLLPDRGDILGAAEAPAVQLFCDRAGAARADFHLTPSLTPAVVEICRRLDGLPLAIELAAARINLLSVQEMHQRLDHRLSLLRESTIDPAPHRHSLANAIAWSYGLLAPAERTLMARLAVFAGGFCLSAAEAICALPTSDLSAPARGAEIQPLSSIADGIGVLLDQSLLIRRAAMCETHVGAKKECLHCPTRQLREAADAESRFSMLEILREFAFGQLQASGEVEALQRRHAEYYAVWAQQAETQFYGPEQAVWLARLEQETDNLRAALTWLLATGCIGTAASMACCLGIFWQRRGHYSEGRRWLERILAQLAHTPAPAPLRARCLQRAAVLAYRQGDWQMAQQGLAESLSLYRAHDDRAGTARVLFDLGWIALDRGEWVEATRLNQESLALARKIDDPAPDRANAVYQALTNLGWAQLCLGAQEAAAALFSEAYEVAQSIGHIKGVAVSLTNLGWVALCADDPSHADRLVCKSLRLCHLLGEREVLAEGMEILAAAAVAEGDARRAARLGGAAEALWEALHVVRPPVAFTAAQAQAVAAMQRQLPEADFKMAWRQGRAMSPETMAAFALRCENPLIR